MSHDGDGKKGKLGFILLILHLIAVVSIISFLFSGYKIAQPTNSTMVLMAQQQVDLSEQVFAPRQEQKSSQEVFLGDD